MRIFAAYQRLNDLIETAVMAFTALVVAVIVLLPVLAVAVRLATGEGYSFLAETAPQLVPWVVFPMVGVLLRRDGHIAVDMLPHFLEGRSLVMLRAVVFAICILATLAMAIFGARTTAFFASLGQLTATEIEFPIWYLYVAYPIGFVLAANFCLESLIGEMLGRRRESMGNAW